MRATVAEMCRLILGGDEGLCPILADALADAGGPLASRLRHARQPLTKRHRRSVESALLWATDPAAWHARNVTLHHRHTS